MARQALAVRSPSLGDPAATREHTEQGGCRYDPGDTAATPTATGRTPERRAEPSGQWPSAARLPGPSGAMQPRGGRLGRRVEPAHHTRVGAVLHHRTLAERRERPEVEAITAIATERGILFRIAGGLAMRGWVPAEQGAWASGVAQVRQGLDRLGDHRGWGARDLPPRPVGRSSGP